MSGFSTLLIFWFLIMALLATLIMIITNTEINFEILYGIIWKSVVHGHSRLGLLWIISYLILKYINLFGITALKSKQSFVDSLLGIWIIHNDKNDLYEPHRVAYESAEQFAIRKEKFTEDSKNKMKIAEALKNDVVSETSEEIDDFPEIDKKEIKYFQSQNRNEK